VLKNSTMLAVLFECGIIKSRIDELQLSNSKYQQKLVDTLFRAITKYVELKDKKNFPK
jgi:N-acetylmuramoyl-L-alanine amidase